MIHDRNAPMSPDEWATRGMSPAERADWYDARDRRLAADAEAERLAEEAMREDTFEDEQTSKQQKHT